MKKVILVALAILLLLPAATVMAQHGGGGHGGGGGGGSHGGGGGSHGGGGGSHGGGSHGGGSGGSWHGGHGGGGWHGGWHGGGGYYYGAPYWGWGWGWGPYWGYGWGPYSGYLGYYGYYGGGGNYGNGSGPGSDWGIVDTDVSPDEARLYLDGNLIGTADDFDGHPDFLYLHPGKYSLEFRLDGYESVTIPVDAKRGVKVTLNNKLVKIPGAKQYGSYEKVEPEGGIQRFWGKRRDGTDEAYDPNAYDPNEVQARPDRRHEEGDYQPPPPPRSGGSDPRQSDPRQSDPRQDDWRQSRPARHGSRLLFAVRPADAAIYLDDRFIGTADELSGSEVPMAAGKHTVTVSRPGFRDKTVEIEVGAGEVRRVDVTLDKP